MAQVLAVTNKGKAMFADRLRATPSTYTTEPKFIAMGTGATGAARDAAAADTALTTEVETRAAGTTSTVTTTQTGDTFQVVGTQTATSARTIDEVGVFDASTVGNMFVSGTLRAVTIALANGDSLQQTWKVQQT
jgi:hypothetical protein